MVFRRFPKRSIVFHPLAREVLILFARSYNREFAKQNTLVSSLISQTTGNEILTRSNEVSRDSARDLKFAKLKTNMAARGLSRKTLFPPSLVSCLRYQLFLPLKYPSFRQF